MTRKDLNWSSGRTINWSWMKKRIRHTFTCWGSWKDGDGAGHKACRKCGVWRWFPIVPKLRPSRATGIRGRF